MSITLGTFSHCLLLLGLVSAGISQIEMVASGEPPLGNAVIRGRAGGSEIILTTTARLAGAIHSLKWKGKEFIDSADHGRQLQSACSFDNTPAAGPETFNPTEAGSRNDGAGDHTTSRLLALRADRNEIFTRTQMAFWLRPSERSAGQAARNATLLSDYLVSKRVRIGYRHCPQIVQYDVTFIIPAGAHHRFAQWEALTGYMPAEFATFWQFNPELAKLEPLSDGPGEIARPVVFATASGHHAMGIYAPPQARAPTSGPSYGRWRFAREKVVKWNCVFRTRAESELSPGAYSYRMLVLIGTVREVEGMLANLTASV